MFHDPQEIYEKAIRNIFIYKATVPLKYSPRDVPFHEKLIDLRNLLTTQ